MRITPHVLYPFAAFLAAGGCSPPKTPEPLSGARDAQGTGMPMTVVGMNQTREINFEFKKLNKMGYIAPDHYYPEIARIHRIEGTVELNVTVSPEGKPLSVEIVKGPESLLNAAKEYALTLQFSPAQKGNVLPPHVVIIGIIFQLQKP